MHNDIQCLQWLIFLLIFYRERFQRWSKTVNTVQNIKTWNTAMIASLYIGYLVTTGSGTEVDYLKHLLVYLLVTKYLYTRQVSNINKDVFCQWQYYRSISIAVVMFNFYSSSSHPATKYILRLLENTRFPPEIYNSRVKYSRSNEASNSYTSQPLPEARLWKKWFLNDNFGSYYIIEH